MIRYLFILIIFILSSCNVNTSPGLAPTSVDPKIIPTAAIQITSGAPTIEPTLQSMQLMTYPPGKRTGNPELDPIIDAMLAHDLSALQELTIYTEIGCTFADGMGGPPKCKEGETEGTILKVVPILGPEGHHIRKSDYIDWEGPDVLGLMAAYSTSEGTYRDPNFPAGEYALVFLMTGGPETLTLQVVDGKVIRYDYDFGGQTADDLQKKADEILLPLIFNPVPTQIPWNAFTDPNNSFNFLYPPLMTILPADKDNSWHLGSRIRVEILSYEHTWITCFYQSLGDCPFVELDEILEINEQEVRRIEGYIGSVGGNIPQEFLCYIFNIGDQALVMTIYALPFGSQVSDTTRIWPLEGIDLELFERTVRTVILN